MAKRENWSTTHILHLESCDIWPKQFWQTVRNTWKILRMWIIITPSFFWWKMDILANILKKIFAKFLQFVPSTRFSQYILRASKSHRIVQFIPVITPNTTDYLLSLHWVILWGNTRFKMKTIGFKVIIAPVNKNRAFVERNWDFKSVYCSTKEEAPLDMRHHLLSREKL